MCAPERESDDGRSHAPGSSEESPNFSTLMKSIRESDMPAHRVLMSVVANFWRKAVTLSNCCGNLGAPGC